MAKSQLLPRRSDRDICAGQSGGGREQCGDRKAGPAVLPGGHHIVCVRNLTGKDQLAKGPGELTRALMSGPNGATVVMPMEAYDGTLQ